MLHFVDTSAFFSVDNPFIMKNCNKIKWRYDNILPVTRIRSFHESFLLIGPTPKLRGYLLSSHETERDMSSHVNCFSAERSILKSNWLETGLRGLGANSLRGGKCRRTGRILKTQVTKNRPKRGRGNFLLEVKVGGWGGEIGSRGIGSSGAWV